METWNPSDLKQTIDMISKCTFPKIFPFLYFHLISKGITVAFFVDDASYPKDQSIRFRRLLAPSSSVARTIFIPSSKQKER